MPVLSDKYSALALKPSTSRNAIGWWAVLVFLTLIAWQLEAGAPRTDLRWATAAILVISMLKIRVVIRQFMEIRHAGIGLKLTFDGWCCLVLAAQLFLFCS